MSGSWWAISACTGSAGCRPGSAGSRAWFPRPSRALAAWLRGRVFKVVLVSRFLPGCGCPPTPPAAFVRADLRQFALAAVVATLAWTTLLFCVSLRVGGFLMDHFGAWRWAGAAGFALFADPRGRFAARLQSASR